MAKPRSNRAVNVAMLDSPERDAPAVKTPEDGAALRARVRSARLLRPSDAHFLAAWLSGRDAAVDAVEGGKTILQIRLERPPLEGVGCRDCWARGRDAALQVIGG